MVSLDSMFLAGGFALGVLVLQGSCSSCFAQPKMPLCEEVQVTLFPFAPLLDRRASPMKVVVNESRRIELRSCGPLATQVIAWQQGTALEPALAVDNISGSVSQLYFSGRVFVLVMSAGSLARALIVHWENTGPKLVADLFTKRAVSICSSSDPRATAVKVHVPGFNTPDKDFLLEIE